MDKTNKISSQTIPIPDKKIQPEIQTVINVEPKTRQDFNAYQSPATSNFMISRKNNWKEGTIDNKPVALLSSKDNDYQLQLNCDGYKNYKKAVHSLNTNTNKFLLFALHKVSKQIPLKTLFENINNRTITIKQKEIKEFFGIKDKKYAKEIMINSSRVLLNSHHTFTFTHYNKKQVSRETGFNMTILDKYYYKNGMVQLQFSDDFLGYMPQQYIAQYPNNIGQHSSTAFQITMYIYELHRKQAKEHKNFVLISIEKLLENTNTIPTGAEIKASNRHYYERIIIPLDNALDEIESSGDFKTIYYCNSKGISLTETQLADGIFMRWKNLKTLYLTFVFKKYDKSQANGNIKKQKLLK